MSDVRHEKSMLQEAADEILYAPDLLMHIFEKNPDAMLICNEHGKLCLLIRSWSCCPVIIDLSSRVKMSMSLYRNPSRTATSSIVATTWTIRV
jgi:hypothetical protein